MPVSLTFLICEWGPCAGGEDWSPAQGLAYGECVFAWLTIRPLLTPEEPLLSRSPPL